jgi:NTP pyrophosphatase (non-canonical NTP hydrolase)
VRDLASYTLELKEIVQELFQAIAGRPKPPEGGQTA